jgi:hypothetical protein
MTWSAYAKRIGITALSAGVMIYAFIALVDPYDNVWFSPLLEREPVTINQRYAYPALARSDRFDSLITGTSSVRLLKPAQLNPMLGASFANLAMNSGTPYEQLQILRLFVRHHPRVRFAWLGIDGTSWCSVDSLHAEHTHRRYPPWMYDENPWNDLAYLFNTTALEQAVKQFGFLTGLRPPKRGRDGYTNFLGPDANYDLERARRTLYGTAQPHAAKPVVPPVKVDAATRAGWRFPTLKLLEEMLSTLPDETAKMLIFPPYHQIALTAPGSLAEAQLTQCKQRVAMLAERYRNIAVLDFTFRSPITNEDSNYWDPLHYRVPVATVLGDAIVGAMNGGQDEAGIYRFVGSLPRP